MYIVWKFHSNKYFHHFPCLGCAQQQATTQHWLISWAQPNWVLAKRCIHGKRALVLHDENHYHMVGIRYNQPSQSRFTIVWFKHLQGGPSVCFGDFSGDHWTARCRQPAEGTSRSGLNRRGSVDLGVVDSVGKLLHRLVYVVLCTHIVFLVPVFVSILCNMSEVV